MCWGAASFDKLRMLSEGATNDVPVHSPRDIPIHSPRESGPNAGDPLISRGIPHTTFDKRSGLLILAPASPKPQYQIIHSGFRAVIVRTGDVERRRHAAKEVA